MTTTIVADHVVVGGTTADVLEPGVVVVDAGVIVSVERVTGARPRGPEVVDLGASVLLPGLVNAHAHAPMMLLRGVSEGHSLLTWEGWLGAIRAKELHLTPDMLTASALVGCAEMIGSGTTSFADQYLFAESYVEAIESTGVRATVAYGIVDMGDDERRDRSLVAAEAFVAEPGTDLVDRWIGPHAFFVDNRIDTVRAEFALGRRYGVGLHAHYATSTEEDDVCEQQFDRSALGMLRELGIADVPVLLAHANDVRRDDLDLLAGTKASLVIAASVAMISGAHAAPVRAALDAGVNVVIGTDNVCGNNNADMFEELRTLGKLAAFAEQRPNPITPIELLGMATWRARDAMGGAAGDGTITPGAIADLIALPVAALHRGPVGAQSVHSALVYGASGFDTTHVMTAGRWLKRDGELVTIDLPAALAQRQIDFDTLMARVVAAA
ncbi:amidohydrolase family protein [Microbacterium sp. cx-55]|uniref:amidohydrolase family protein n=1 Tax=Microbacterium sp. cx-55 TaxID=2875948 RepID=UPI001CBE7AF4|nr:amidohydrolase family protein [Microbacterium sp. cx-55]MBZ4488055.1 amidohydrolase family protein [Microbacterium sp. cx-55]UGB34539.1 amidohydrolase family protein [Microbacterium sp. cx-55]